jgi:hypothetical protein
MKYVAANIDRALLRSGVLGEHAEPACVQAVTAVVIEALGLKQADMSYVIPAHVFSDKSAYDNRRENAIYSFRRELANSVPFTSQIVAASSGDEFGAARLLLQSVIATTPTGWVLNEGKGND